jgi:glycosyltransferase involved in cell wall biosynthesis
MRIGIDARMMSAQTSRGIGRYVEELVRAMLAEAPEHRYVLVTRQSIHSFSSHPSVETAVADVPWYGIREQIEMPRIFRSLKCDVLHVPHWNVPVLTSGNLVVTIHDLLLRHEPKSARLSTRGPLVSAIKRVGYRMTLAVALAHAKAVLVPTKFVAEDLRQLYPRVSPKIIVTGEGISERTPFAADVAPMPPRQDYLLYVGSAYPHKGLDLLLDAWGELEVKHPSLYLKIAGAEDVFMQRLKIEAQRRGLPRIEFLGYVSDESLAKLYHEAVALVIPSRFEGFGLTPLEAIQAGCPVVSSDAAALVEVLGDDGAFFFQTGSKNGILSAIERVLADQVAAREKTKKILPALQIRHNWKNAASLTLAAYDKVKLIAL